MPNISFKKFRLHDVAPVFNLIIETSREGAITPLYQQANYMAGLAIQLFCILFFGRFHIQGHGWFAGTVRPLYVAQTFVGFLMLRSSAPPNQEELYLFAIDPAYRKLGLGEFALREYLGSRSMTQTITADCLPQAKDMQCLLKKVGFRTQSLPKRPSVPNTYIPFIFP